MARGLNKLSAHYVSSEKLAPGRHSDGGGLYLNVAKTGAKSWLFMWVANGKRSEMGLGSATKGGKAETVTLKQARERADEIRLILGRQGDPLKDASWRKAERKEETFGAVADAYVASMKAGWKNDKHRDQWEMTLGDAYCSSIRPLPVGSVTSEMILEILNPIWQTKSETASRLRGRIEKVLDYAKAKGWRTGANPALWRGHLDTMLPKRKKLQRGHHAAMAFEAVPAFMRSLQEIDAMGARALEFLILTAARSNEVLGAKWPEIDMVSKVWIVPKERMKAGREHRVPLSDAAFNIVQRLHNLRVNDFVFPGMKAERPLSNMAMPMILRRMEIELTVHGFRSAFRDWAGDRTSFPRDLAEAALAHAIRDQTEAAYRRSDALEKRRKMMTAWANFLANAQTAKVIPLHG